ncbi:MAG: HEAT repeat domain-containing protein [Verrucomicrobia bacterium]|nr:HEAT repeat domain-containing protein [Verrucomicrobiota bacterium]
MNRFFCCVLALLALTSILPAADAPPSKPPILDCFISTGDNHWMGSWLPIDSKASIEASLDLLKRVGVRRVYWRGLQEAAWLETMQFREENCRYASFWKYLLRLDKEVAVDRLAVEAAHKRGMEIWGVSTMFDWGSATDTPCFGDFPHNSESRLRQQHPEWVPVDKHGVLRQGGPIEFAYPEARKALTDLHLKFMDRDGYDGMAFLTYVENFSLRFPDEFGFCEPAVTEFKRRTGVDLRTQPFGRNATRYDWQALRGEAVTAYLRELKAELAKRGKKLGVCLNPNQPRLPQFWTAVGATISAGHIQFDLDTWVRDGVVDQFVVWGGCHGPAQLKSAEDCLWLTRDTKTAVAAMTSSPFAERWQPFHKRDVPLVLAVGDDWQYLEYCNVPEQPLEALQAKDDLARLRVLAQVVRGKTKATVADLTPLAKDANLLVRRMALLALAKTKDPEAVLLIEAGLADPENAVRCVAAQALRELNRPESAAKLLATIQHFPTHPLMELAVSTLPRIQPLPRAELAKAATGHGNPAVRVVAMRALGLMANEELVPVFAKGLNDSDRFVRFAAAQAMGNITRSPKAIETLIEATKQDNVVVSDRAATSLAQLASRRNKEVEPLRPRMVEALKNLYTKLGDGCARADADWGYRPVGNALLKFDTDGERVLQAFMDQRKDRRLAEQAWKSLYVRLDNGAFNETCEKEADEAFKKLPVFSRELRVDPAKGNDASAAGPFKTITRAIAIAGPGDTIHLMPGHYKESAAFLNKSGEPGHPITLDGHGATLDGAEPLKPADWEMVSPGLYRNRNLLPVNGANLGRWFFVFDGKMNHMGRTSKGPSAPLKKAEELAPGEWTYVPDAPIVRKSEGGRPWDARQLKGAFYIKIDPAKALADYHIEAPLRSNGVSLSGRCEHLVIRNVTSTHVHNDGFNIHGYTRDILFENVKAVDCGDDGVSAHDDCQIRVNVLVSSGNSTGICDVGDSVSHYNRVFIKDCLGFDLYFLDTNEHSVSNSVVMSSAARTLLVTGRPNTNKVCTLRLDNVLVHRMAGTNEVRVTAGAVLDARRVTLCNLNFLVTGGAVTLRDSVVAGAAQPEISIWKDVRWQADRNLYDARFIRLDQTFYSPKTFSDYQRVTGQDKASRWLKVEFKEPFDGQVAKPVVGKGMGTNVSRLPSEMR